MNKGKIVQVVGAVVGQPVNLTLEYNKLRQGNITKELLEIAGGQLGND